MDGGCRRRRRRRQKRRRRPPFRLQGKPPSNSHQRRSSQCNPSPSTNPWNQCMSRSQVHLSEKSQVPPIPQLDWRPLRCERSSIRLVVGRHPRTNPARSPSIGSLDSVGLPPKRVQASFARTHCRSALCFLIHSAPRPLSTVPVPVPVVPVPVAHLPCSRVSVTMPRLEADGTSTRYFRRLQRKLGPANKDQRCSAQDPEMSSYVMTSGCSSLQQR